VLIMSRKPGETVTIGDQIVVKVMEIKGGRVQLGIQAPKDVKIDSPEAPERQETQRK
jgi:carbon storage regulator